MDEDSHDRRGPAIRVFVRACLVAVLFVIALFGFAPAGAAREPDPLGERRVTETYMTPAPSLVPVHPYGAVVCNRGGMLGSTRGCMEFPWISIRERFLTIEITDASGLPVPAYLQWGDSNIDEWIPFCGRTTEPLRIQGSVTVYVVAQRAPNLPLCPGTATTGEATATFSTRR